MASGTYDISPFIKPPQAVPKIPPYSANLPAVYDYEVIKPKIGAEILNGVDRHLGLLADNEDSSDLDLIRKGRVRQELYAPEFTITPDPTATTPMYFEERAAYEDDASPEAREDEPAQGYIGQHATL